jgi:L-threonylcarbamoyladenylate synthase
MRRIPATGDLLPAAAILREGGIVCYPTETLYALGADPWNPAACERLRALKGRQDEKEWPLITATTAMIADFCRSDDPRMKVLAGRFWPGPLTVVLPALSGAGSYAVRVSSCETARRLSELLEGPVISTSANPSGDPPVSDPDLLPEALRAGIDCLVDGGLTPGGLPSTIVSLLAETRILREGAIPAADVLAAL